MSGKNTNVWTIAEAANGKLKSVSYELLARGRSLADACGEQLVSILIGANVSEAELTTLIHRGADLVISVQDPALDAFIVETYSNVLIDFGPSNEAQHHPGGCHQQWPHPDAARGDAPAYRFDG